MNDLKFALRQLLKHPGFTAVAVLTLALGIGANTAMFSVVNAVLIKPLPYPDPERLVAVLESNSKLGWDRYVTSMGAYSDWRDQASSFRQLGGAIVLGPSPAVGAGGAEMVHLAAVSANFFPLLGLQPILGRSFTTSEESPGRGEVVLLSEHLWRSRFGADPNVVNQSIRLGDRPFTIVGIMPSSLRLFDPSGVQGWDKGFSRSDLWRPLPVNSGLKKQRSYRAFLVLGRLKPRCTVDQAQAEMTGIARQQATQFPESNGGWAVRVLPWSDVVSQQARLPLLLLFGATGVVLLIMTANLANLYLARVERRERELAVRMALGASRLRLLRQLLVESLAVSCAGGAAGLLFAGWSLRVLLHLIPASIPRAGDTHLDGSVLGFTLAASVSVGMAFGLVPVLTFLRSGQISHHRLYGRGMAAGRNHHRSRSVLIASQMALVVVLVSGAGLLVRSFRHLSEVNPGFRPDTLMAIDTTINGGRYTNELARILAVEALLRRLAARPDLESNAAVDGLPLDAGRGNMDIALTNLEATPPLAPDERRVAGFRLVSPAYFDVMRIPLLRGRTFTARDNTNSTPVVIINEALARRYFGGVDPIGQRISSPDFGTRPCEVVGVVGNVRHTSLEAVPEPEVFRPLLQECFSSFTIISRTRGAANATTSVRQEIASVDGRWPVYHPRRLEDLVNDSMARRRFASLLLESFAGLALLMAYVGIQGVLACVVGERRREIAIRLAVGGQPRNVAQMVLGHTFRAVAGGALTGLMVFFALGRFLSGQLYGIAPTDPATMGAVVLLLSAVSLFACWVPLQRATAVEPFKVLKDE